MKGWHWIMSWMAVAPTLVTRDVEDSRRERQAASRRHKDGQSHNWTKALDIIDRQEGKPPPMDAIEAMLRGRKQD